MADLNPYQTPQTVEIEADLASPLVHPELRSVRQGLYIVYYGIVSFLIALAGGPVCLVTAGVFGFDNVAIVVGILMALFLLSGFLATFVGQVRCVDVPAESEAKAMIVGAIICQALGFLLMIGAAVIRSSSNFAIAFQLLTGVGPTIVWVTGVILFLIFLRRLNVYIGNGKQAGSARTVIGMVIIFVIFYFLLGAIRWGQGMGLSWSGGTFMLGGLAAYLAILLLGLVTFVKCSNLVLYTARWITCSE